MSTGQPEAHSGARKALAGLQHAAAVGGLLLWAMSAPWVLQHDLQCIIKACSQDM